MFYPIAHRGIVLHVRLMALINTGWQLPYAIAEQASPERLQKTTAILKVCICSLFLETGKLYKEVDSSCVRLDAAEMRTTQSNRLREAWRRQRRM